MKFRLFTSVALFAICVLSSLSCGAEAIRTDFSGPSAGSPLNDAAFAPGAGPWRATANLAFAGGADGGIAVTNESPFMGRVAIAPEAEVVVAEADLMSPVSGWVALGLGAPKLGTPTWGRGLYVIVNDKGGYALFGNDNPADWMSKSAVRLKVGGINGFAPQTPVRVKLQYDKERQEVTLWINQAMVADRLGVADRGFTVEPSFAGFSGFQQPAGTTVVRGFAVTSGERAAGESLPTLAMKPGRSPAWWTLGEAAEYRVAGKLPGRAVSVRAEVFDVDGNVVFEESLPASAVQADGWRWTASEPGFYEVLFHWMDAAGNATALGGTYGLRAPNGTQRTFAHTRMGFGVLPQSAPPESPVGQFGFTYTLKKEQIELAKLVGFDLANIHSIPWGAHFTNLKMAIEPVKGEYRWEILDPHVDALEEAGMVIAGQFCYTPLWASPYPEKTNRKICVVEGTSYAPVDIGDYERFVAATVERYQDRIHIWELWNEPAVPGGSVFWSDTPENFVELLHAGYVTVKGLQPDSEIWLGGLGGRPAYYSFFRRILELGAAGDFDVLSLHGRPPLEEFRRVEDACDVPAKPVVVSEWHAILQNSNQTSPLLDESALSMRMLSRLFLQLKNGVKRTVLFEMYNLVEKEALLFGGDNKWFVHSAGLFRSRPELEPRQAAVVMANFLQVAGRQAAFDREFALGDDSVAFLLATGHGPLAVCWSPSAGVPLEELRAYATDESVLTDWEGKRIALDGTPDRLPPGRIYYLTHPATERIATASDSRLVAVVGDKVRTNKTITGQYVDGPLFDLPGDPVDVPADGWIEQDWEYTALKGDSAEPALQVKAAVGVHPGGVDFVFEVRDDIHVQDEVAPHWWSADSVQIAVDCESSGILGGNTELIAALTPTGPVLYKLAAADPRGDIPSNWTPAGSDVEYGDVEVTRENGLTRYAIRVDWAELYPLAYEPGKPLYLSLLVNDGDGAGRAGYQAWGGGIGDEKDPYLYGKLQSVR